MLSIYERSKLQLKYFESIFIGFYFTRAVFRVVIVATKTQLKNLAISMSACEMIVVKLYMKLNRVVSYKNV